MCVCVCVCARVCAFFQKGMTYTVTVRLISKNERTYSNLTAGRVEIFFNKTWGTVCSNGFDSDDASVLCRKLTGSSTVLMYGVVESEGLE